MAAEGARGSAPAQAAQGEPHYRGDTATRPETAAPTFDPDDPLVRGCARRIALRGKTRRKDGKSLASGGYLWNGGVSQCTGRLRPRNYEGLAAMRNAGDTPAERAFAAQYAGFLPYRRAGRIMPRAADALPVCDKAPAQDVVLGRPRANGRSDPL